MTIQTNRSRIRHYISTMLKDEIDVEGRVYVNEPSVLFEKQLPAVTVSYGDRESVLRAGTKYHTKKSNKKQTIVITVGVPDIYEAGDINLKEKAEDYLDYLSDQIEKSFELDWNLARRLDAYDENNNYLDGLIIGNTFVGDSTYQDIKGEIKLHFRSMRYDVTYETYNYPDFVFDNFESYLADIEGAASEVTIANPIQGNSFTKNFDYTDFEGSSLIGIIPKNKYAAFVIVVVDSVFDTTPLLTIGDSADNDRLQEEDHNNLLYSNSFLTMPNYKYLNDTELYMYLSGNPTMGSGRVIVYYY